MGVSLIKSRPVSPRDLVLYYGVDGLAFDPFKVELELLNGSTGASVLAKQDITSTGRLGLGQYGLPSWTPSSALARGRAVWYVTPTAGAPVVQFERDFEVLDSAVSQTSGVGLVLLDDLRQAGLTTAMASDVKVHLAILRWSALIEKVARQRFRPTYDRVRVRGESGSGQIPLPETLAVMTEIYLNESTTPTDITNFRVFGGGAFERGHPFIEVASSLDFFAPSTALGGFVSGMRQHVVGLWGFFDAFTGRAPEEIRQACITGVILTLAPHSSLVGGSMSGRIKRERTDSHEIEYALSTGNISGSLLALLKDPAIRDAINLYRGPVTVAAPYGGL